MIKWATSVEVSCDRIPKIYSFFGFDVTRTCASMVLFDSTVAQLLSVTVAIMAITPLYLYDIPLSP